MSVYVDDMFRHPIGQFRRMKMSHMVADTRDELLHMADRIGLNRRWLQHPDRGRDRAHFDVSMTLREKAIAAGAIEMTMRNMAMMRREWRDADRRAHPTPCIEESQP